MSLRAGEELRGNPKRSDARPWTPRPEASLQPGCSGAVPLRGAPPGPGCVLEGHRGISYNTKSGVFFLPLHNTQPALELCTCWVGTVAVGGYLPNVDLLRWAMFRYSTLVCRASLPGEPHHWREAGNVPCIPSEERPCTYAGGASSVSANCLKTNPPCLEKALPLSYRQACGRRQAEAEG